MQSLKDTFHVMLRDRVAGGNAARTALVRGVTRPGVIVVENELPGGSGAAVPVVETFCVRWTKLGVDTHNSLPLTRMGCEIRYATDGTSGNGGMDRGRALAAMDAELSAALSSWPWAVAKSAAVEGQAGLSAGDGTNVFWGELVFEPAVIENERMERTATVEVYCYGQ